VHIASAMTTERDVDKLLGVILEKSRFVTGADAGQHLCRRGSDEAAQDRAMSFRGADAALQALAERVHRRSTRASS
jgi:hypothetical protein